MSSEQPRRSRDTAGSAGSPMGSTAAIIIAVVAVVAGFLILGQIRGDDGDAATTTGGSATTAPATDTTLGATDTTIAVITAPPASTVPPIVTDGATAVVANASRVNGAAGVLTTALLGAKFTLGDPTNATTKVEVSVIYYDPADPEALAVATSISTLMGGVVVETLPAPAPVEGGALQAGVSVLVMLGSDKAALTLEQMGTPTTVAAVGTETTLPAVGTDTTAPA